MPELPPVREEFIADGSEYLAFLDAATAAAEKFAAANAAAVKAVRSLQESLDGLAGAEAAAAKAGQSVADAEDAAAEASARAAAGAREAAGAQRDAAASAAGMAGAEDAAAEAAAKMSRQAVVAASMEKALTEASLASAAAERASANAADAARDAYAGVAAAEGIAAAEAERLAEAQAAGSLAAAQDAQMAKALAEADAVLAAGEGMAAQAAKDQAAAMALATAGMGMATKAALGLTATTPLLAKMLTLGTLFKGGLWTLTSWHYILDGAVELAIVIGGATIALTAFGLAGARTADAIVTHFQALNTVAAATGHSIAPLTSQIDRLQTAMAPAVIQLYGDALQAVNAKTGAFATLARQSASVLDYWGARASMALQRSATAGMLASKSAMYLNMVMQFLATTFGVVGNVMRTAMDTHIAEILFGIATGAMKVLGVITSLPTPLLAVAMGLHGLWLWGKFGGAILGSLAGQGAKLGVSLIGLAIRFGFVGDAGVAMAGKLGASMQTMTAMSAATKEETGLLAGLANVGKALVVPALLAAGAAAVYFAYKSFTAQSATDKWAASMQAAVNKAPMFSGLNATFGALARTNTVLASSQRQVTGYFTEQAQVAKITGVSFNQVNAATWQQILRLAALSNAQKKFTGEAEMAAGRVSYLAGRYGGLTQAIGLASLAGVKWSDVIGPQANWTYALQKISAMVEGYRMMGQAGSAVANDANAVTFSIEMQDSKVAQLNQAWQTFITTVQSGQTGFVGFEQQMLGMGQALAGTTASLTDSNGKISLSSKLLGGAAAAAGGAKASFNGLSASSLGLRATFQQTITSASTLLQNISTMGAAMANGAQGEHLIASASRDVVAQLIPLGAKSAYVRAEVYALAQEAGYHGVNSLKAMSQWAGTTAGSASRLNRIMSQLTIQSSSLTRDVAALGSALGINLNSQMSHAMETATGFSGKLNTAISDLLNSKVAVGVAQKALHAYWAEQVQVTGSVHGANTALELLTQRIMEGKVAAAGAHPDMTRLAGELESIGRKASMSQGQIVSMIAQVTHMSRQSVEAALSASNLTHRFGDISTAAQNAAGRLAGMGNNAAAAAAQSDAAITRHLSPLAGKLRQIGQQAVTALGNAIRGGSGHVSGAASAIANQAHAKVAAMAGQFHAAGVNASQGLAAGIAAGAAAAVSAAQSLVDRVNSTLSGVKGLNVHSPSKLWHQYGFWAVQGLVNGMVAGMPKLMGVVQNMINSINRAFKGGSLTAAQDSSLVRWVKSDNAKLQALAAQRQALAAKLAAVTATEKALQSSFSSIIGLGHAPAPLTAKQLAKIPTAQQMVANLRTELADIKKFANDLKKLKALGLDNSIIQRIIAMGPIQGDAYAQALISAAGQAKSAAGSPGRKGGPGTGPPTVGGPQDGKKGGPGTGPPTVGGGGSGVPSIIQQLNNAYQQIQSYSKQAGDSVTKSMYGAGVQAAKGLVAGLKAQMHAIDAQMKKIADALVKAIRRDLKSHSPSRVMHDEGLKIPMGIASGIDAGGPMVAAAMKRMTNIITGTRVYLPPMHQLSPMSGGSSGPIGLPPVTGGGVPMVAGGVNPGGAMGGVTIHLEVHGHVVTDRQLLDFVRDGVQQYLHKNVDSGLTRRPGR